MQQYRITTETLAPGPEDGDCVLPENDPIHEMKKVASLGGLGAKDKLAQMRLQSLFPPKESTS